MKKNTYALLAALSALFLASCNTTKIDEPETPSVPVSFEYSLAAKRGTSMSATKATNPEIFELFYEKMTDGSLTAPSFELTFVEVNNGFKYTLSGNWADKKQFSIRTGTYQVTGVSVAPGDVIQEKCSLLFNETVVIDERSTTITLGAEYDCSLMVFSDASIAELYYNGANNGSAAFFSMENYFYAFIRTSAGQLDKDNDYLSGTHTNGTGFTINISNFSFDSGKYYIYTDIALAFNLPYMEEGGASSQEDTHPAVDLGLSVKWAAVNVGAATEEGVGSRFAWGEISPNKDWYDWDNYRFGMRGALTKYYASVDGKTQLDAEDDAARSVWGGAWRMPTKEEAEELFSECEWTAETINDVSGFRVTGKNNNSIFIPCNGQIDESGLQHSGMVLLWTSECTEDYGYRIGKSSYESGVTASNERHDGLCIRPVCK